MDQLVAAEQPPIFPLEGSNRRGVQSLHPWKLYAPLSTGVMTTRPRPHRQPTEQKCQNSGRRDCYVTEVCVFQASSSLVHGVRGFLERQAASSVSFLI